MHRKGVGERDSSVLPTEEVGSYPRVVRVPVPGSPSSFSYRFTQRHGTIQRGVGNRLTGLRRGRSSQEIYPLLWRRSRDPCLSVTSSGLCDLDLRLPDPDSAMDPGRCGCPDNIGYLTFMTHSHPYFPLPSTRRRVSRSLFRLKDTHHRDSSSVPFAVRPCRLRRSPWGS